MCTFRPRYDYLSLLHLKRINYWLEQNSFVNLRVSISKELQTLKVIPRFRKNVKEMLKYRARGR